MESYAYLTDLLNDMEGSRHSNGNDANSCISSFSECETVRALRRYRSQGPVPFNNCPQGPVPFNDCQQMKREDFYEWLESHGLGGYRVYFEEDGYVLQQGEYPNELEVFNATVHDLMGFLLLPKTSLLCTFFDRDIFVRIFLSTYVLVMSPEMLFSMLVEKYELYTNSITFDPDMRDSVIEVIELFLKQDHLYFSADLQLEAYSFLSGINKSPISLMKDTTVTKDTSPSYAKLSWDEEDILLVDPKIMAEQLTLREQEHFSKLDKVDWIHRFHTEDTFDLNTVPLFAHHMRVKQWVITEILRRGTRKKREEVISYFLKVCKETYLYQNFSTMEQIISALCSKEIEILDTSYSDFVKEYKTFLFEDDFAGYIEELETRDLDKPFLPLLLYPIVKVELTNIHMDTKINGKFNFQKMKNIHLIFETAGLLDITYPYMFTEDKRVSKYLDSAEVWLKKDVRLMISRELHLDDKQYQLLDQNKLWNKTLDTPVWDILYSQASMIAYYPGDIIIQEGSEMKRLYQIKTGQILVMKGKKVVSTLEQDTFIAMESYLHYGSKHTSNFKYVANSSVCLFKFKPEDVLKLCQRDHKFSRMLNYYLANQILSPYYVPVKLVKNKKSAGSSLHDLGVNEVVIYESSCQLKTNNYYISGKILCSFNSFAFVSKERSLKKLTKVKKFKDLKDVHLLNGKFIVMLFENESVYLKTKQLYETFDDIKLLSKKYLFQDSSESENISLISGSPSVARSRSPMSISQEEWKRIFHSSKPISFSTGEIISEKGNDERQIYYILSGRCSVLGEDNNSIADFNSGQMYGKMSFLFGEPANFTFRAETETSILVIEPYLLNFLFENESSLGGRFYYYIAQSIATRILDSNK
eukprot:TRINITY_DN1116_c0_g1_i1.p1 TRINITY_DN1116_c0_g1~~TRINITY_DN1116_c0_g1_i1.p1  ORF type:complete len:868 (+),score=145.12 TRINITY_DN1116_c0_g1_i1:94-2697(+)